MQEGITGTAACSNTGSHLSLAPCVIVCAECVCNNPVSVPVTKVRVFRCVRSCRPGYIRYRGQCASIRSLSWLAASGQVLHRAYCVGNTRCGWHWGNTTLVPLAWCSSIIAECLLPCMWCAAVVNEQWRVLIKAFQDMLHRQMKKFRVVTFPRAIRQLRVEVHVYTKHRCALFKCAGPAPRAAPTSRVSLSVNDSHQPVPYCCLSRLVLRACARSCGCTGTCDHCQALSYVVSPSHLALFL